MRLFLILTIMTITACTHGTVGFRQSSYKEIPQTPLNQSIAAAIGPGTTVTILEGPNEQIKTTGQGLQFGAYTPFGNNWDFDVVAAFETYSTLNYRIQYQNGMTSGILNYDIDITGTSLDLALGYRWSFLRPYAGLRRDVYIMTTKHSLITSSTSVSNYFAFGGLEATLPISDGFGISAKADYSSALVKDSTIKSADKTTIQVNLIWGLGQRR